MKCSDGSLISSENRNGENIFYDEIKLNKSKLIEFSLKNMKQN